ncbi:MAG: A/G-specific adenine glycosylase [Neisseriaceae bacterium]|nr:A/G-specific adenine glycosylase [Neisseriaceae bacterium]MBP6862056.1 A/G-specific adenine glycosylase [Neisseriaceae bacterium]
MTNPIPHPFTEQLIAWQKTAGRHHLPWQVSDAYRVWLSEVMLQQTQVVTVLDYYPRFVAAFPTVADLAAAPQDDVLALWAGLGYYSRARNLHFAAKQVVADFNGCFPNTRLELETLKGVGRSTAAAIAAFAFQKREAILDGNVKRVLCRVFEQEGLPNDKKFETGLWALAESLLPAAEHMGAYTQGLMDLGATVCKRSKPLCEACPMSALCLAHRHGQTERLPLKKPKQVVPIKPLYWLILSHPQAELLVEKRPDKGIWGGLYCVPTFDTLAALTDHCQTLGIDFMDLEEQVAINHRLTHFQLIITPYVYHSPKALPEMPEHLWATAETLNGLGMPKPLLNYLKQSQR